MVVFNHIKRKRIFNSFTSDYLTALLLLTGCRFDDNLGCLSGSVIDDLDGDHFFFFARLQQSDFENALFDPMLRMVLIGKSEETIQLLITRLDLVVRHSVNP